MGCFPQFSVRVKWGELLTAILFSATLPPMLSLANEGLYCRAGDFYIDPRRGVENAVVTHAHADHARRGSAMYYVVKSGVDLLLARLGRKIQVKAFEFGETFEINGVRLSFHPAGHILGSSQVRVENGGEVWVASGDYKREADPTCEPFEIVKCDVFVTEATFGTPTYVWPPGRDLGGQIMQWWEKNEARGVNSLLFGYSLGKMQRILGVLAPWAPRPIYCHEAAAEINLAYRRQGIELADTICLSTVKSSSRLEGELILAPQAFLKSPQAAILGGKFRTAFASGWMLNGAWGSFDEGFLMSDHADWNDLVRTCVETGAKRVYVQHRGQGALVKHLNTLGIKAYPEEALLPENSNQMALF